MMVPTTYMAAVRPAHPRALESSTSSNWQETRDESGQPHLKHSGMKRTIVESPTRPQEPSCGVNLKLGKTWHSRLRVYSGPSYSRVPWSHHRAITLHPQIGSGYLESTLLLGILNLTSMIQRWVVDGDQSLLRERLKESLVAYGTLTTCLLGFVKTNIILNSELKACLAQLCRSLAAAMINMINEIIVLDVVSYMLDRFGDSFLSVVAESVQGVLFGRGEGCSRGCLDWNPRKVNESLQKLTTSDIMGRFPHSFTALVFPERIDNTTSTRNEEIVPKSIAAGEYTIALSVRQLEVDKKDRNHALYHDAIAHIEDFDSPVIQLYLSSLKAVGVKLRKEEDHPWLRKQEWTMITVPITDREEDLVMALGSLTRSQHYLGQPKLREMQRCKTNRVARWLTRCHRWRATPAESQAWQPNFIDLTKIIKSSTIQLGQGDLGDIQQGISKTCNLAFWLVGCCSGDLVTKSKEMGELPAIGTPKHCCYHSDACSAEIEVLEVAKQDGLYLIRRRNTRWQFFSNQEPEDITMQRPRKKFQPSATNSVRPFCNIGSRMHNGKRVGIRPDNWEEFVQCPCMGGDGMTIPDGPSPSCILSESHDTCRGWINSSSRQIHQRRKCQVCWTLWASGDKNLKATSLGLFHRLCEVGLHQDVDAAIGSNIARPASFALLQADHLNHKMGLKSESRLRNNKQVPGFKAEAEGSIARNDCLVQNAFGRNWSSFLDDSSVLQLGILLGLAQINRSIVHYMEDGFRHTGTQPDGDTTGAASPYQSPKLRSTAVANKQPFSGGRGKRSDMDDDDDEDGMEHNRPRKRPAIDVSNPERTGRLACHFWKFNPVQHRKCFPLNLQNVSRIKQHLRRAHYHEFYCDFCNTTFPYEEALIEHVKERRCEYQVHQRGFLTHSQMNRLSKKSKAVSEMEKWYDVWDILFPTHSRPDSPYVDRALSEDVSGLVEFVRNRGPSLISNKLQGLTHDAISSSGEEGSNLERAISEGLSSLLDAWMNTITETSPSPGLAFESEFIATHSEDSAGIPGNGRAKSVVPEQSAWPSVLRSSSGSDIHSPSAQGFSPGPIESAPDHTKQNGGICDHNDLHSKC